jgi:glutathione S-transferase
MAKTTTKKPASKPKAAAAPKAKAGAKPKADAKPAKAAATPKADAKPAKAASTKAAAQPAKAAKPEAKAKAPARAAAAVKKAAGAAAGKVSKAASTVASKAKSALKRDKPAPKPALTLSVLKPSVNNLAVRIFTRAAGLVAEEKDVYGSTRSADFLKRNPAHMTPMMEEKGLPKGVLWESCAIMSYLANKHGLDKFYSKNPAKRAMVDSAMFYLIGTLYPLVARATYGRLGFGLYPGEVGSSDLGDEHKAKAQKAAQDAIAEPLEVFRSFYMDGQPFIGGKSPSIADIRLAATLEFLDVIDYAMPKWTKDYMAAMEKKLGKAYSEPAADVRGYISYVRSKAA